MNLKTFLLLAAILALFILVSCKSGGDDDSSGDDGGVDNPMGELWTDSTTGLMWQNGEAVGVTDYNWADAKNYCAGLSWGDYGDWRLPTISELRSLIRGCPEEMTGGACRVTDSCLDSSCSCFDSSCQDGTCGGCDSGNEAYWPDDLSGKVSWYWSSSPVADLAGCAWVIGFESGHFYALDFGDDYYARCVR